MKSRQNRDKAIWSIDWLIDQQPSWWLANTLVWSTINYTLECKREPRFIYLVNKLTRALANKQTQVRSRNPKTLWEWIVRETAELIDNSQNKMWVNTLYLAFSLTNSFRSTSHPPTSRTTTPLNQSCALPSLRKWVSKYSSDSIRDRGNRSSQYWQLWDAVVWLVNLLSTWLIRSYVELIWVELGNTHFKLASWYIFWEFTSNQLPPKFARPQNWFHC